MVPKRDTRFKKGQSGNPSGRTRSDATLRDLTRNYTEEALAVLIKWMQSEDPSAAVKAASTILDRGWGKARQEIELTSDNITGIEVSIIRKTK